MSVNGRHHDHEPDLCAEFDMASTPLSSFPRQKSEPNIKHRKTVASACYSNRGSPIHQDNESLKKSDNVSTVETPAFEKQPLPFVKEWAFDIFINVAFLTIVLALLIFAVIAGRLHGKPLGAPNHYTVLRDISDKASPPKSSD